MRKGNNFHGNNPKPSGRGRKRLNNLGVLSSLLGLGE